MLLNNAKERRREGEKRYKVFHDDFVQWCQTKKYRGDIVFIDPPWQLNSKDDNYAAKYECKLHLYAGKEENSTDDTNKQIVNTYETTYRKSLPSYKLKNAIRLCFDELNAKMVIIKVPSNFHMDDDIRDPKNLKQKVSQMKQDYDWEQIKGGNEFVRMEFYMISKKK